MNLAAALMDAYARGYVATCHEGIIVVRDRYGRVIDTFKGRRETSQARRLTADRYSATVSTSATEIDHHV